MAESIKPSNTAKKIGELLIEMGFITEAQLTEALDYAKKKNIRAGEAMVEMGIISKDHVYWILGTQLNMSYIEVQPDTIEARLVRQFPIDELRRLKCIPLYESKDELHFAIASPADADEIRRLAQNRSHMRVMLNLALPDKIEAALDHFADRAESAPPVPSMEDIVEAPGRASHHTGSGSGVFLERDLQQVVGQLTPRETLWIELMGNSWHALVTSGQEARPLRTWQRGDSARIIQWLEAQSPRPLLDEPSRLLPTDPEESDALIWGRLDGLAHQLLWVRRLSVFDRDDFMRDEPAAEAMMSNLRAHTDRYRRVLVGAAVPSIAKRCWFAAQPDTRIRFFPRPITLELQIEYLNRDVMQLEEISLDIRDTLLRFPPALQPPILLELDPRVNDRKRLDIAPLLESCSSHLTVLMRSANAEEFDAECADLPDPLRRYEKIFLGAEPKKPVKKSSK